MNRTFNAAPLDHTQDITGYAHDIEVEQLVTLAAPGTVDIHFRRGTESQVGVRLDLADLDTLIATLRTARKIVAKR